MRQNPNPVYLNDPCLYHYSCKVVGEKHIKTYNYINWFNFKLSTPNLK